MSMSYLNGLRFISAGESPDCNVQITKNFGNYFALNFLWRGRIHFRQEQSPGANLDGPMAYWTLPKTSYIYGNVPGYSWHQLWVVVCGPRISQMLDGGLIIRTPKPWQHPSEAQNYLSLFRTLLSLVRNGRKAEMPRLVCVFEQLLAELHIPSVSLQTQDSQGIHARLKHTLEQIATSPGLCWDFVDESRKLGISYHHLRRLVRQQTGRGPTGYLLDCRLREATALLRTGEAATVKIAAYQSGFRSPHDLARLMRRRNGITPANLLPKKPSRITS